jgi:UDP-GlcNAc:undecaprenyl-phosphate/decaprenyl-phosphate GlcNAc-1-phosphate transferase
MTKAKRIANVAVRVLMALALAVLLLPPVRRYCELLPSIHWAYLLAHGFLIAFLLMPIMIRLAPGLKLIDKPDTKRKRHSRPTPVIGGIAIYLAFAATILLNFHFSAEMKGILIGCSLLFVVGVLDDRFGLPAWLRLLCQVGASLYLVYAGVHVTFVPAAWVGGVAGKTIIEAIITIAWLVGITNSMNFIDGMDGLASGTSIIYSIFFSVISVLTGQGYMMYLAAAIAGSCLGFFPYNFRKNQPAQAFLGDSGATILGFVLASFAILGEWGASIVDIVVPVLIMSVLIFDMTLTTVLRIHSGEVRNFSQWLRFTGRDHFHHRLASLGFDDRAAALLFFGVSVCFGLAAVALLFSTVWVAWVILAHSILAFTIVGIILVRKNMSAENGTSPAGQTRAPAQLQE